MFKSKKRVLSLFVAFAFVLGAVPMFGAGLLPRNVNQEFHHAAPDQAAAAFATRYQSLSNQGFNEQQPADFTSTVSGWSQERTSATAVSGILNTRAFNTFRTNQNLTNPIPRHFQVAPPTLTLADDWVLVMGNRTEGGQSNVGFTSSDITLYANGFFIISIDFYAVHSVSQVYLIPTNPIDEDIRTDIEVRQTLIETGPGTVADNESVWQTANFFIRTDELVGITFRLGLFLGERMGALSGGVVYYDNVRILETTEENFDATRNDTPDTFARTIDLRRTDDRTDTLLDANVTVKGFVPTFPRPNNARMGHYMTADVPAALNFEETLHFHAHNGPRPREVMLVAARDTYASMKLEDTFTIERNLVYMLSFYAIAPAGTSANIRIRDIESDRTDLPDHITPFDSGYLPVFQNSTDAAAGRNNWIRNTFFLTGDVLNDIDITVEFWIGQDGTNSTGWVAVDSFAIRRVSNEYLTQHRELSNVAVHQLSELMPTEGILNAAFNIGTIRGIDAPFPLRAESWEHSYGNEMNVLSGIVNTDEAHWVRFANNAQHGGSNYGMAVNPRGNQGRSQNNNVYMMQNTASNWQTLRSNSFTLHSGIYTVITFDAATLHFNNLGMNFVAVIEFGDIEIARIDLGEAARAGGEHQVLRDWRPFSFAIRDSGFTTREVTLTFKMGIEGRPSPAGTVFLDNVRVAQETTVNPNAVSSYADLSNALLFANPDNSSTFFVSETGGIETRVNRASGTLLVDAPAFRLEPVSVQNTLTEELSGGGFFRYSIELFILNDLEYRVIEHFDDEYNRVTEPDDVEWGIGFTLEDFEGGFANLTPENIRAMDSYDGTYTTLYFYIRAEATTDLSLVITFGNKWRSVRGGLVIRSLTLEQIEEIDWTQAHRADRAHIAAVTEGVFVPPPVVDPPTGRDGQFDWLIIPSIIMALAIFLAVITFTMRRVKFNRRMRRPHTSYHMDDMGVDGASPIAKPIKTQSTDDDI